MNSAQPKFRGVFAPIPTPFASDGSIDWAALKDNVAWWCATKLAGLVVLGSNGEAGYLDFDERAQMVEAVVRQCAGRKTVVAGVGMETTGHTMKLAKAAAAAGADAVLVLPPHFYEVAMTGPILRDHYRAVADACPVPVILYNMPGNTGLNLGIETPVQLSSHPNIVGLKDSSGDIVQISEIIAGAAPGFAVFAGSGSYLLPTLVMGGVGATAAVANVFPDECTAIIELFEAGKLDLARQLQQALLEANRAVTSRFNVPGLKAALEILGHYGGPPRLPMQPLDDATRATLEGIIRRAQARCAEILSGV